MSSSFQLTVLLIRKIPNKKIILFSKLHCITEDKIILPEHKVSREMFKDASQEEATERSGEFPITWEAENMITTFMRHDFHSLVDEGHRTATTVSRLTPACAWAAGSRSLFLGSPRVPCLAAPQP